MKNLKSYFPPSLIILISYILLTLITVLCLKHLTLLAAPFFISLVIAYLFHPLVKYLQKKTHLSRATVSALMMLALVVVVIFLMFNLLPYIVDQISNATEKLPEILNTFSQKIKVLSNYLTKNFPDYVGQIDLSEKMEALISNLLNDLTSFLASAFTSIYGFFTSLLYMVFIPLFAYYFIKDSKKIIKTLIYLIPFRFRNKANMKIQEIDQLLSSFIRGQAIVILILSFLYSVGLTMIGLPFAILIGIFAGIGDIIPYFGTIVGLIISLIVGFVHYQSAEKLFLVILVFSVVKFVENWFFYPKIVGKEVGLHFVWVLFSIILFSQFFGFWGLVIAIPSSAIFNLFVTDLVKYYKGTPYYRSK